MSCSLFEGRLRSANPWAGSAHMNHQLRILHISDLHARGNRETTNWRRRQVLGGAWERNLAELSADGNFDFVFFTGDVADWGKPQEYADAEGFFVALLSQLQLPRSRLLVVPGNHDIDRSINPETWRDVRLALMHAYDSLQFSQWMAGYASPPSGFDPSWRELLLERGGAFRQWYTAFRGATDHTDEGQDRKLGFRVSFPVGSVGMLPFAVHIIGLDTAWLAGDDNDAGNLMLTRDQVGALCHDAQGDRLQGIRLGLMHHPFTDLRDGENCRRLLTSTVDLILRGHLHATTLTSFSNPDHRLVELASGCLYEGHRQDEFPNACNAITITSDDSGRLSSLLFRFRSWTSEGGFWHDNTALYEASRNGRLTVELAQQRMLPTGPEQSMSSIGNVDDTWMRLLSVLGSQEEADAHVKRLLSMICSGADIPLDRALAQSLTNDFGSIAEGKDFILNAEALLRESGSNERALLVGMINLDKAPAVRARDIVCQAGLVGPAALAAVCGEVIIRHGKRATQALRVFKQILDAQCKRPS